MAMYRTPLVPPSFDIPQEYRDEGFLLKPLTIDHADQDYLAVSEISPGLTKHQNLIDLGWHQKEFQKKSSFTYTVLTSDGTKCLGCVYIYPSSNPQYDAEISMWVIKSWSTVGGDKILLDTVKHWVNSSWPFKHVYYAEGE